MSDIYISVEQLRQFMTEAFRAAGVPPADADAVVDVLIRSDLRGIESHGIGRFKMYIDRIRSGILNPVTHFEIVRESPGVAVVDGHDGMGHLIAYRSMRLAMDKARQTGIAAVSVRNSSHFGIAGYYPLMAARENMAGMAFTNARPSISPTFGADPMFGTNPIAFAVPTDEGCPFCLDMATSIVQRGKIEVLERKQKPVPAGLAIDKDGRDVLDATTLLNLFDAKAASLLPLGGQGEELAGYKGYGLAMMVEILSSIFNGGPFGWALAGVDETGQKTPHHLGHFFIAMDIAHFMEPDQFKKLAGDLMRSIRASGKLPGETRIYTAGEKEYDWEQIVPNRGVALNESLEKDMRQVKKDLNLAFKLPF